MNPFRAKEKRENRMECYIFGVSLPETKCVIYNGNIILVVSLNTCCPPFCRSEHIYQKNLDTKMPVGRLHTSFCLVQQKSAQLFKSTFGQKTYEIMHQSFTISVVLVSAVKYLKLRQLCMSYLDS
jgi:hypothetical protein